MGCMYYLHISSEDVVLTAESMSFGPTLTKDHTTSTDNWCCLLVLRRASPLSKVSTLSSQSVSLAADLRRLCDQEAAIQAGSSAPPDQVSRSYSRSNSHAAASSRHVDSWAAGVNDGQGGDGDLEVVLRGGHDCWVVGRQTSAGRHLYVAYEGERGDGQNVEAITGKMQQLCDRHFTGAFDGL